MGQRVFLPILVTAALLAAASTPEWSPAQQGTPAETEPPASSSSNRSRTESEESVQLRQEYAARLHKRFMLEREKQLKSLQLQLAADDTPYLVVDLADQELRIMIRTVKVRVFPLLAAELEGQRELFSATRPPPDWANEVFTLAAKSGPVPDVKEIQPQDPQSSAHQGLDPRSITPELLGMEEDEYPSQFTLLYRQGLAVHIGGSATLGDQQKGLLRRGWDRLRSLIVSPELPDTHGLELARFWIHIGMPEEEAHALYPSLFTDMGTMVRLPGDPRL